MSYINDHIEWSESDHTDDETAYEVPDITDGDWFLDTDDPWCGFIVAQLIIAFSDENQSMIAPF